MTTFVFTDINQSLRVEYKTDLMPDSVGAFTILDIIGLDDAETELGFTFKKEVQSIDEFIDLAVELDMKLERFDSGDTEGSVIQDFTGIYYMGGLGIDNL